MRAPRIRAIARLVPINLSFNAATLSAAPAHEIQRLFRVGDVDGIETYLHELHQSVLTGETAPDDRRRAVAVFSDTNPDLPGFLAEWRRAYPVSTHAEVATGWAPYSRADAWILIPAVPTRHEWPCSIPIRRRPMPKTSHRPKSFVYRARFSATRLSRRKTGKRPPISPGRRIMKA